MGLDVYLYATGEITDEQIQAANDFFSHRISIAWLDSGAPVKRSEYHSDRVVFDTLERYCGPGYERGNWPGIYGAIRALQHLMPDATVYYCSDSDDEAGVECAEGYLSEMWEYWLSTDGDAYRRH